MKKISAYILAIFSIVLISCQKEFQELQQSEQDGKVTFSLGFTTPEANELTKALGETVDLETNGLWVLVYENGYRIEAVKAENVTESTADSGEYTCDLTLSVTENKRNLHFISMAGFNEDDAPYEETRLGSLTSADGLDAYWQIRKVSKIPYNLDTTLWNNFLSELKGPTGSITLIRNFAKVTMSVKTGVKFQLTSFKVFKTPSKGYVAPYNSSGSNTGFVSGYDLKEYDAALSAYPGRMPDGCTLSEYTPADDDGATFTAANGAQYFYERPVPTKNPAFIIVKGKFDSDANDSYYKINLRDNDDNYYALLRGFRFKVSIESVTATGHSTVVEAYNSAGSGDISTSLEYSSINNISDGICRLFVNETSFTTIKEGTIQIKYKFIPDFANDPTTIKNEEVDVDDEDKTGVEITVNAPESGIQPSIKNDASSNPMVSVATSDDSNGWRTITVSTNAPESLYKEQVITIRGRGKTTKDGVTYKSVLQRDIHIIVRPMLTLSVEMAEPMDNTTDPPTGMGYSSQVPDEKGSAVSINILMEDELPKSIFPLNVKIEATSLTLTPAAGEQLPVESGQSASTTDRKPTFYFVKTISWNDYTNAPTMTKSGKKMRKFTCNFNTNADDSASSIYVSNELFNTASTKFTNPPKAYTNPSMSLSPKSPGNWSATATGEPYAGQEFDVTVTATVTAGTTVSNAKVNGVTATSATVSGTTLTIKLNNMIYGNDGFYDLPVTATLTVSGTNHTFEFSKEIAVWEITGLSFGSQINSTSSIYEGAYIIVAENGNNYYVGDNNDGTTSSMKIYDGAYYYCVWQVKGWNSTAETGRLLNYSTGKYVRTATSNTNASTTTNSSNIATLNISRESSYWQIKMDGYNEYLNNYSGSNSQAYWYSTGASSDSNSRWRIWLVNLTCTRPTD